MKTTKQHLKNIIQANNDNRLAVFVGAGISKSSDGPSIVLPTWEELIEDLKSDLDLGDEENDFLKIAQLYFLEFKEHAYYEKLRKYFPSNIEPSLVHKLIFEINPQCIITTNWDIILEKTIENNAYVYDVVSSDKDLVKSTLPRKLIKMHGDFKNHNIVFKEDDYLNYQYNFPIIENYIKSILSTHTILFLGYSYNDMNLKHIMKWLQNHSKVSPPMYITTFSVNNTQEKYLENHGITALELNDVADDFSSLDKYSAKTATFLDVIANPSKSFINLSDDEIVSYIYGELKILDNLDQILLGQIRKTLTNCGFSYTTEGVLLELYKGVGVLTYDFNKEVRARNEKFITILDQYDKGEYKHKNLEKIFLLLSKANISGVILTKEGNKLSYIKISTEDSRSQEMVEACLDFRFDSSYERSNEISKVLELAYNYYQVDNYEAAYEVLEEAVSLCLKQLNHTQLFLVMFNRNILLRALKFMRLSVDHSKYRSVKEYDLKEKFNNLPKDLQIALEPIYYFINFDYLYKYAYEVSSELKKKEDQKRIIEQGGMVFNNDISESVLKHQNLVLFLLKNKIMIEDYVEYKTINKYFIEISLTRQSQSPHTKLNKIEIYSCIKYISNKDLKLLFKSFYVHGIEQKSSLSISEDEVLWLIKTVLPNLTNLFMESSNNSNIHENHVMNVIFLLSLINISKKQTEDIMAIFSKVISASSNTLGIYDSINHFLALQYNLFNAKINDKVLVKLVDEIILKLVYKQHSPLSYYAITTDRLSNLYGCVKENKAIYNNENLVTKLLLELSTFDNAEQLKVSQSILLSIYDISNRDIKDKIKTFILDVDDRVKGTTDESINFELLLVAMKFKEHDDSLIRKLNQQLKQYEDGTTFSSTLYTLKHRLEYLVNDLLYSDFKEALEKTNRAVEMYEHRKKPSIF